MPKPLRRLAVPAAAALALLAGVLLPATAASASSATGWLRVAHFSPDTDAVDVSVTARDGGQVEFALKDVTYGTVSKYVHLAPGAYRVAMRPADSSKPDPAIVEQTVQIRAGGAKTVAVFGRNAALKAKVLTDDLAAPERGTARVRVIQASTAGHAVSVATRGGPTITSDAADGVTTAYATVPAQTWHLEVRAAGGSSATSTLKVKNGEIVSVVVLDTPGGGLTVRSVVDSATVGDQPAGYLATGGGFLAHQARAQWTDGIAVGVLLAGALSVGAAGAALRRRTRRA